MGLFFAGGGGFLSPCFRILRFIRVEPPVSDFVNASVCSSHHPHPHPDTSCGALGGGGVRGQTMQTHRGMHQWTGANDFCFEPPIFRVIRGLR